MSDSPLAAPTSRTLADAEEPRSRDRQREATRRSILDSALHVFSEQGFEGATTRAIAGRAGVNHAMIQYYFQSKEALWQAAVRLLFERLDREVNLDPARIETEFGGDARAFARAGLTEYVRYCARHPEHARLMMQESVRPGERMDWLIDNFARYNRRGAKAFFGRLIQEGLLPDLPLGALTYIVVGACQLYYALAPEVRLSWKEDPLAEPNVKAHVDALLTLLLR